MTAASTYGRQTTIPLVNKSGGQVIAGDVVQIGDGATADSFTTTTTSASVKNIGIAQETIASNATGRILTAGYAALVNVNASVTINHYGSTHTVAKQATDAGASRAAGTFCLFLTAGTTPDAMVFANTDLGGGSGASTADHFVTTTSAGDLSAQTLRQHLANYSPESSGYGSGTGTDEFDDSSWSGWTKHGTSLVDGDFDETSYVGNVLLSIPTSRAATQTATKATYTGGDFNVVSKMWVDAAANADQTIWGIMILSSAGTGVMCGVGGSAGSTVNLFLRNVTTFDDAGSSVASSSFTISRELLRAPLYLKLSKASGVYTAGVSFNGVQYQTVSGSPTAFTVAIHGFGRIFNAGSSAQSMLVDYVRASA